MPNEQSGWIFQIHAPKNLAGKYLAIHRCGMPQHFADENEMYLIRMKEGQLDHKLFDICDDILFGIEPISEYKSHPRYPLSKELREEICNLIDQ